MHTKLLIYYHEVVVSLQNILLVLVFKKANYLSCVNKKMGWHFHHIFPFALSSQLVIHHDI